MTTTVDLLSGDTAPPPDVSAIPAFIFPVPQGTDNAVVKIRPGDNVITKLGGFSEGAERVSWFLRNAKQSCVVGICADSDGSKSAITHTGTGPTVTAAFTSPLTGPLATSSIGIKVTKAGAGGVATMGYFLDGSGDYSVYSATIPAEGKATLRGTEDITLGAVLTTYAAGVFAGLHLDFTAPTADVLTFVAGSLAASAAGLRAAFATSVAVQTWTSADLLDAGEAAILANPRKLLFTTAGGTASDAPATCSITGTFRGAAQSEAGLVLSQVAGTVISAKEYSTITSIVFAAGDGNGATIALGYSDRHATAQEIATAATALAVAAGLAATFTIYEDEDGSFLEATADSGGTGVTLTIDDGASDADDALGYAAADSNITATGTAATFPIPRLGLTLTFPATADYVLDDTYVMTTVGPGASVASIAAAADAIRSSAEEFGYILPLVPPSSAANCLAMCASLDGKITTWQTDENAAIFPLQLTPGPYHTPSATPATNFANVAIIDQALIAAFASQASNGTVVPGDGYMTGTELTGSYRAPAALGVAYMMSRFSLSDDPGAATHSTIPEWSLTHPDGVTLARDDANPLLINRMGGSQGGGWTVLRNVNRLPRVAHGTTRAGLTSRLQDLGPGLRVGRRAQTVLYSEARTQIENENYAADSDGRILEGVRKALEGSLESLLADELFTPPLKAHVSSRPTVEIDATEINANTRNLTITAQLLKLINAENITITVLVSGTVQATLE